ncbi:MAG: hypothetical protein ABSE69_19810 [Roseiarcus sp.]
MSWLSRPRLLSAHGPQARRRGASLRPSRPKRIRRPSTKSGKSCATDSTTRRYRPLAASARSREEMAVVVNAMLAQLGASHTHYYTPEDPAYYQLADIFSDALRRRGLQRVFPTGEVTYPGIGVFTRADDQGRAFVTGVVEGAPAHQAGLLLGDEIL